MVSWSAPTHPGTASDVRAAAAPAIPPATGFFPSASPVRRVTVALANGARLTCNDPACVLELLEAGAELADRSDLARLAEATRKVDTTDQGTSAGPEP